MTVCSVDQGTSVTVMHTDEEALLALVENTPGLLDMSKSKFSNVAMFERQGE
ncbi:MAG: hypothetical protein CM1200mP41_37180 [Gammaproteobacteria bacterium]|nr:MAG: hypothetical protein CM1200mP41_37180 [Gammaproteobacteria bacterium]